MSFLCALTRACAPPAAALTRRRRVPARGPRRHGRARLDAPQNDMLCADTKKETTDKLAFLQKIMKKIDAVLLMG